MPDDSEVEFVHAAGQETVHCIVYADPSEREYWNVTMCGETPPRGQIDWIARTADDTPLLMFNVCAECMQQLANNAASIAKRQTSVTS